jgi:hypothetical protein
MLNKSIAIILIVMSFTLFGIAMGWGIHKKFFEHKISWSNYEEVHNGEERQAEEDY